MQPLLSSLSSALAALLLISSPALAARARIESTLANPVAEEVLRSLISTPLGRATPWYAWSATVVQNPHLNAFSYGAGEIKVTSGLASLLGDRRGAWAVVLGHEIGHFVISPECQAYLPGFQAELQKAYLQARAPAGDPREAGALQISPISSGMVNLRRARKREYEADHVALMMMAEAGYHPDFAIAFERQMHFVLGDQPKHAEFLLAHPRWASREEQTKAAYDIALAIFQSRWPSPAQSPGGGPPPLGTISRLFASRSLNARTLVFDVAVNARNTAGTQARVAAIFLEKGKRLQTTMSEYRSSDGSLVLNAFLPDSSRLSSELSLRLPSAALGAASHQVKAMVLLIAGSEILDISIVTLQVRLRKG